MIYQKFCKNNGLILVDVIVAFGIAAVFAMVLTELNVNSEKLLDYSSHQRDWLKTYVTISSTSASYGNEFMKFTISSTTDNWRPFVFDGISSIPMSNYFDLAGTPNCSPRMYDVRAMGSYAELSTSSVPHIRNAILYRLPINTRMKPTDIQVRNHVAYISFDSNIGSDPDFGIFDIRDPLNIRILSLLNTGPGISAFKIAGRRAYAAITSTVSQLQIIHISSLNTIALESSLKLRLPYATATPALGSSLFYSRGFVYLGTQKWDGHEFNIIDVSDSSHPAERGSVEVGSKVGVIYVSNDVAYIGTAAQEQLESVDVHNKDSPSILSVFSPDGWQRQEASAIDLFQASLLFARTSGGFDMPNQYELFGIQSSTLPTLIDALHQNVPQGIYGVLQNQDYAYKVTRNSSTTLSIIDNAYVEIDHIGLPITPIALTCDNHSLYVLDTSLPQLYELSL